MNTVFHNTLLTYNLFLRADNIGPEVFLVSLLISTVIMMGLLSGYALTRKDVRGAYSYAGFTFMVALYSLFYSFEILSPGLERALLWSNLQYIGISFLPAFGLLFIFQITMAKHHTGSLIYIIPFILSLITLLLKFTDHHHGLVYADVSSAREGHFLILDITPGIWYWIHIAYINLVFLLSVVLLLISRNSKSGLYPGQVTMLIAGIVFPWVAQILYVFLEGPGGIDLNPPSFFITSVCFGVGIFRYGMLSVSPIARDHVFLGFRDGIVVIDKENRLADYNVVAAKIFKLPQRSRPLGENIKGILKEFPTLLEFIDSREMEKTFNTGEIDRKRILLARKNRLYSKKKIKIGTVVTLWDITYRHQSELRLKDARKRAEAANRAKTEFVANMSHEIRTPMNSIMGYSEALLQEVADPAHKRMLDSIRSSGNLLLALLNDILDISRIEAGQMKIMRRPVTIRALFSEIIAIFRQQTDKKGLQFSVDISEDIPGVLLLDETRIKQILLNLTGNAVKYTHNGEVKISARYKSIEGDSGELLIEVADTGIGIPRNQLESVFRPFIQQQGQNSRQYEGTGLGLTISRRLIQKMGGSIRVKSRVGKGSVFTVCLPCKRLRKSDIEKVSIIDSFDEPDSSGENTKGIGSKIKPQKIVNRDELLKTLKEKFIPKWKVINNLLVIFRIEQFAGELLKLSARHRCAILEEYAGKLVLHSEVMDVEKLKELLGKFPNIVSELESQSQ